MNCKECKSIKFYVRVEKFICDECGAMQWFVNDVTNTLGQIIAFMDIANIACLYYKENGGHYNAKNRSNKNT